MAVPEGAWWVLDKRLVRSGGNRAEGQRRVHRHASILQPFGDLAQYLLALRQGLAAFEGENAPDVLAEEVLSQVLLVIAARRCDADPQWVGHDVFPGLLEGDLHGVVTGLRDIPAVEPGRDEKGLIYGFARHQDDLLRQVAVLGQAPELPCRLSILLENDRHRLKRLENVAVHELRLGGDVCQLELEIHRLHELEAGPAAVDAHLQRSLSSGETFACSKP